jgi:hypothetical protein
MSSPFVEADLDAALADAPNWSVLENTLYGLCQQYPGHDNRAGSNAKLWLIGRGLATGIERQIASTGGQGSTMLRLCDHVHQNYRHVDEIVSRLRGVQEPLNQDKLRTIVEEHGRFCRFLSLILRRNGSARSFAAKYLHCHCPAVPIYDSVACKNLGKICEWQDTFQVFNLPPEADEAYYWFVLRFWQLYQAVQNRPNRPSVTVRMLDLYLLW